MKYIVVSNKHGLLPFAWSLRCEERPVRTFVAKKRYAKAWQGRLGEVDYLPLDERDPRLDALYAEAAEPETLLLTDSPKWGTAFREHGANVIGGGPLPKEPVPPLRAGAWFDGTDFKGRHALYYDIGTFPGGLGAAVEVGCTLVAPFQWPAAFEDALQSVKPALEAQGLKGLVEVGLRQGDEGLLPAGWHCGWPWLQTHCFVAQQASLGDVLEGGEPRLPSRFLVAMAVSLAPWPYPSSDKDAAPNQPQPIGLPEKDGARRTVARESYFHDVSVHDGELWTAGLDGLVAVTRGAGFNLEVARNGALVIADAIRLPERQLRVDVGVGAGKLLAWLESQGVVV